MELLAANPQLVKSGFGRLETRLKIISIFTLVVIFSTLKSPLYLAGGTVFLLVLAAIIGVSLTTLLKRFVWLIPFAGIMIILFPFITPGKPLFTLATPFFSATATEAGLIKAGFLALRVLNATLAVSLLVLTTPLQELLHGFQQLKVPGIMVNLIAFTLRYFEVLADEVRRMKLARKARGFQSGSNLLHWHTMKTLGLLLGTLFVRSAERGERIFYAMLARGYRGEVACCGHCTPKLRDWITGLGIVLFGLALKIAEWKGMGQWLS